MGEAKVFLSPCETNVLHPVIRIEIMDSGRTFTSTVIDATNGSITGHAADSIGAYSQCSRRIS